MISSNDSDRLEASDIATNTIINIDSCACAVSDDGDDDDADTTVLSPACCSRFSALTGLDLNEIKRELGNNRYTDLQSPTAAHHGREVFKGGPDHVELHRIEAKAMALSRIDGPDELYVGGVFAIRRPGAMEAKGITSILSMIKYSLVEWQDFEGRYVHLSVDVDDVDDEDILVHLPRAVRFVDMGLGGSQGEWPDGTVLPGSRSHVKGDARGEEGTGEEKEKEKEKERRDSLPETGVGDLSLEDKQKTDHPKKPGAVFVHCAMGKSRSVTAVLAYLLWAYPHRYGLTPSSTKRPRPSEETARKAVQSALEWVRKTREIAEPNPGFMQQLEMWVMMGMPADSDDAVERNGTYQRWIWEREVEESAKIGKKPAWLRFEDETEDQTEQQEVEGGEPGKELRCKKCRRVLATKQFIIPHQPQAIRAQPPPCPHHFIEALSWMKPVLEEGELGGRLVCPNAKCGASIGRYAWQGFKCSCGEWVCPAFSLQASKVDEVVVRKLGGPTGPGGSGGSGGTDPRPALGIRMPPGMGRKENL